jgi:hypothetical protein
MPFFSRHEPEPVVQEQPPKKHGLFSSHHEPAPAPVVHEQQPKKQGLFGRGSSPTNTTHTTSTNGYTTSQTRHSTDSTGKRHSGLLSKLGGRDEVDPSIVQARERVMRAEAAEHQADRALIGARESVRLAREEVRRLELEAAEDARRAKLKQHAARDIGKRGQQLGRKFTPLPYSVDTCVMRIRIDRMSRPWHLETRATRTMSTTFMMSSVYGVFERCSRHCVSPHNMLGNLSYG